MTHIVIRNVGPIKDVEFDLNKINVFMGPQSSGKSTIAKIISYCSWYEKNTILGSRPNINFYKDLLGFHNLEDNYFNEESLIEYKSPNCHIIFKGNRKEDVSVVTKVGPKRVFRNEKIEYIPAERNVVAISGIGQYVESKNNILSFLYDWFRAKRGKKVNTKYYLPLKSLNNVAYYYVQDEDTDKLVLEDGKEIKLQNASSGLITVTPLLLVYNYVINEIYDEKRTQTPFEIINLQSKAESFDEDTRDAINEVLGKINDTKTKMNETRQRINEITSLGEDIPKQLIFELNRIKKELEKIETLTDVSQNEFAKAIGYDAEYCYSKVIIEEPELNLFPKAQQDLVYYMLEELVNVKRDNQLVITTHSPYILFALNNCMMGGLVKKNIPAKERKGFSSFNSWIDPQKVSIYEIHDGELKSIQDEDGIIEDNYLNKAYKENSAEYLSLLNYFEDEE